MKKSIHIFFITILLIGFLLIVNPFLPADPITSFNNLKNKKYNIVYELGNLEDSRIYQCGVNVIMAIETSGRYNSTLNEVYTINGSKCYVRGKFTETIICQIEIFFGIDEFFIFISNESNTYSRAIKIDASKDCSRIFN
jgi:hypothetical protein